MRRLYLSLFASNSSTIVKSARRLLFGHLVTWILVFQSTVVGPIENFLFLFFIVVVDTNQWFHSTYVHPGNVSITVGAEYD